jgi:hypothetical protein
LARYRRVPAATINDLRQASGNDESATVEPAPTAEASVEVSYRDLQAQAKELGIAANQSREDLEAAIAEAEA